MRVERVEAVVGNYPLKKSFTIASGTMYDVPQVFVTIEVSHNGNRIKGFGHNSISPVWGDERLALGLSLDDATKQEVAYIQQVATELEGFEFNSPFDFYRGRCLINKSGLPDLVHIMDVSPIELSLWDAYGKALRTNVFDIPCVRNVLKNNNSRRARVMYTLGADEDPDSVRQVIDDYGITSFKLKVKGSEHKEYAGVVSNVCGVKGVENVVVDANQSFDSITHLRDFIDKLHASLGNGLFVIETPFGKYSDIDVNELDRNIPVIADENLVTHEDVDRLHGLGYAGLALKPPVRTVAGFLKSLHRARELGMFCVVMDLTTGPPIGYGVQVASASKLGDVPTEINGFKFYDWDGLVDSGFSGDKYKGAYNVKSGCVDTSVFLGGMGWGVPEDVFNTYKKLSLI